MIASPCDVAFFVDDYWETELARQSFIGSARTPDFPYLQPGRARADPTEVDSRADSGGSGPETPKGPLMPGKIRIDELCTKLVSLQEPQAAQEVTTATTGKASGIKSPLPVGLVIDQPLLSPIRVPEHDRSPSRHRSADCWMSRDLAVSPPPRLPPGLERPRRAKATNCSNSSIGKMGALRATAAAAPCRAPVISAGTVGHPDCCAEPCLDERCNQGMACPRCHLCTIQRTFAVAAQPEAMSIGSMGHPRTCAEGCKFFWKGKGCKDGTLCTRCHICRWSRFGLKKK
mmetsp:Transcript_32602/g.82187  ORF Transcript_32602/g.82187 Transcript_32602/m.82187 type:complete len:287 (-) Transcript_32602:177-1037(-)